MKRTNKTVPLTAIVVSLLSMLLACNQPPDSEDGGTTAESGTGTDTAETETSTDGAELLPCPKLQARIGDICEPVTVTGISTEPFEFERDGWTLAGTLYRPEVEADEYDPPGAVILHGSGPQGRMGLVAGGLGIAYDPPFPAYASLAEQLTLRGFAVLTYDKRSCFAENSLECPLSFEDYPGDPYFISLNDFLEDARMATRTLHETLDQEVIVIGHSKGAMFVPLIGADEPGVCGVVMLAGATLSLAETVSGQLDDLADYIESVNPSDPTIEELRTAADEALSVLTQIEAGTYPASAWMGAPTQFWADWIAMQANLQTSLANLDLPVYAAFAGSDLNVGPSHFEQFESWAAMGVPATATTKMYPDHTHIFLPLSPEPPGYADAVSDTLLDDLAAWLSAGE
jgi:alpha-beta hydrolase superfamily lysophospholipase